MHSNEEALFDELAVSLEKNKDARIFRTHLLRSFKLAAPQSFRHGSSIIVKPDLDLQSLKLSPKANVKLSSSCIEIEVKVYDSYSCLSKDELTYFNSLPLDGKTSLLTDSFASKVIFVKIPKGLVIKEIAEIGVYYPQENSSATMLIICEKSSTASLIIRVASEENQSKHTQPLSFAGLNIRVAAAENARLSIASVQDSSQLTVYFEDRVALLGDNAQVNWNTLLKGSSFTSSGTHCILSGIGSNARIMLLYFASQNQKYNVHTSCAHNGRKSTSDIQTKGVIAGSAKALSRGLITIGKDADNSSGYEKQDALLLSEFAEADAIPNLEINNNNVTCSHGSTIGHIDTDKVHYLMSKGLSELDAKKLIVTGYFVPVVSQMGAGLCNAVEESISQWLGA